MLERFYMMLKMRQRDDLFHILAAYFTTSRVLFRFLIIREREHCSVQAFGVPLRREPIALVFGSMSGYGATWCLCLGSTGYVVPSRVHRDLSGNQ